MRIDHISYPKSRRQDSKTLSRIWIFIILAALVAVPINLASSGRATKAELTSDIGNKAASSILPWVTKSPLKMLPFLPQAGPTITTYQSDCTTPKSVFNLQASEFGVCAKVTGFSAGQQILWSNANFVLVQSSPVGSGESTFTLSAGSSLGDWRVILYEPLGGSVYAMQPFTVVDNANPSADLAIVKGSATTTVAAGSQAFFTVVVTNLGPSDVAEVQITDGVPENTAFSSFALVTGPSGFNCINPTAGATTGTTVCTGPMARGEIATFLAAYDVGPTVPPGTGISNTASVVSVGDFAVPDPRNLNDSSSAAVTVSGPAAETCILDCPANKVVTADTTQGGQPGAFVTFGAASVEGDCGAVTNSPSSGSFFTVGTHSIVSQSEIGGASCTFTVTVLDTAPPTITCPPNITHTAPTGATEFTLPGGEPGNPTITSSGSGTVTAVRSDDRPAVYDDNGNVVTPAVIHSVTDPYPIGSTGILWTVTDPGGRTASCSQLITIVAAGDRDPVTIDCPDNVTFQAPSGSCQATIPVTTIGTPTTNPEEDVTVTPRRSDDRPLSDPFPAGATTITWTATDETNGNVASCTQTVTVTVGGSGDTTPPTFTTVPQNVTTTTASCTATLDDELGTAEADDGGACGGAVTITRTGVPPNFVFPTGTTTVIYTATDAAGNTAQVVQLVTVTESPAVPPTVDAPANVSRNTGSGATTCGVVVTDAELGSAIANDNCPGVQVVRTGVPAGNFFPVGSTIVTYTATDASGNTAMDTQTVTVTDNTLPIVTPPGPVTLNTGPGATSCGVTVSNLDGTLGTGSATDNCPGVGAVSRSGVPGSNFFPVGNTTVTYSATDAHGNTGTATQVVTVVDNTNPVISCPANIIIEPTCPTGAKPTYATPTATDNCGIQSIVRTAGGASGTVFPIGTTTVTHQATDIHGNTASCSFTVTVLTPQAVIQNLQAAVSASSLTGTQKNGLLSKLSAALQGINGGQINVACNKLAEFNNSVGVLINNGSLSAATGNAWILSSNHVRNTIGCTNLPCS